MNLTAAKFSSIILLFFFMSLGSLSNAQSFYGSGGTIPDYDTMAHPVYYPIQVSGLQNTTDTLFGLERVCIDSLLHPRDGDLIIELMNPDSLRITLCFRRGVTGDNFISTCFRGNGSSGIIGDAANIPPYTGEYDPDGPINSFNNGSDPNGTWYLIITDQIINQSGALISWHIEFGNDPTQGILSPCNVNDATFCQCPDGSQQCDLLPDIITSELCIIQDHYESGSRIYLGNSTPNIGYGPLEIHGSNNCFCDSTPVPCSVTMCPDGNPPRQQVLQTIYHKDFGVMSTYNVSAGTMSYHPSHGHVHLDDWAFYSLRRFDANLSPGDWPLVGTGNKQSYCLINIGNCTSSNGYCVDDQGSTLHMDDIPNSTLGAVTGCGTDQGIYVGYLDIYNSSTIGQWIDLPTMCNGDYYIVSITDPLNLIHESNDSNNIAVVPITLTQQLNLPFPTCSFSYVLNNTSITCNNTSLDYDSLVWDFGDNTTVVNDTNPTHTYLANGTYNVVLTAYNVCGSNQQTITITVTNVGITVQSEKSSSLKVIPNPSQSATIISFNLAQNDRCHLVLFDVQGKMIPLIQDEKLYPGFYSFKLNKEAYHLTSGIYTLRLITTEITETKQLILID